MPTLNWRGPRAASLTRLANSASSVCDQRITVKVPSSSTSSKIRRMRSVTSATFMTARGSPERETEAKRWHARLRHRRLTSVPHSCGRPRAQLAYQHCPTPPPDCAWPAASNIVRTHSSRCSTHFRQSISASGTARSTRRAALDAYLIRTVSCAPSVTCSSDHSPGATRSSHQLPKPGLDLIGEWVPSSRTRITSASASHRPEISTRVAPLCRAEFASASSTTRVANCH